MKIEQRLTMTRQWNINLIKWVEATREYQENEAEVKEEEEQKMMLIIC